MRGVLLHVRMGGFAAIVPLLMRLPLGRLERLLTPRHAPRRAPACERELQDALDAVLRRPRLARRGCLTRGVTTWFFLRRAGVPVELAFGVGRPDGGELSGHCWLVRDGEPVGERRDPRPVFVETYRLGRCAA